MAARTRRNSEGSTKATQFRRKREGNAIPKEARRRRNSDGGVKATQFRRKREGDAIPKEA
jgi:hypothetical protein